MVVLPAMATFKCNNCGNLHGARVENCGMCGSEDVALMNETPNAPPAGSSSSPSSEAAQFFEAFKDLLGRFETIQLEKAKHQEQWDEAENERRERVATAAIETLGAFRDLAEAGAKLINLEIDSQNRRAQQAG